MIFIPGRIEILGKHTDYCGGHSIVCTIDKGFSVYSGPRTDHIISVTNTDSGATAEFDLNSEIEPQTGWTNYIATVAQRVAANFASRRLNGVNIKFSSNLPMATGLSSSSALIIAIFSAIADANNLESYDEYKLNIADKLELADYLGTIENGQHYKTLKGEKGVGTLGGSQDHTAILCCKKGFVSRFSFAPVRHLDDIPFPGKYCFAIASSGVKAEKTANALEKYNRVSNMVSAIVSAWKGEEETLAQILANNSLNAVKSFLYENDLPYPAKDLCERIEQFYFENFEIIPNAVKALLAEDIEEFGRLAGISHQNAARLLKNQIPETNFLQSSALEIGAVASSAFGAGFGGSVYAIVPKTDSDNFLMIGKRDI